MGKIKVDDAVQIESWKLAQRIDCEKFRAIATHNDIWPNAQYSWGHMHAQWRFNRTGLHPMRPFILSMAIGKPDPFINFANVYGNAVNSTFDGCSPNRLIQLIRLNFSVPFIPSTNHSLAQPLTHTLIRIRLLHSLSLYIYFNVSRRLFAAHGSHAVCAKAQSTLSDDMMRWASETI